jgi:tetratricopeptide (TPR) repeat protein/membrane protease YdiL (CAAX protease family)
MKWLHLWCACLFLLALPEGQTLGLDTNTVSVPELIQLGRAELASNHWEAAVSCFRLASETEPTNSTAYALLGYGLAKLDRHQKAVDAYEISLALNPQKTNAWYYLGDSYRALGNNEKAVNAYENYVSLEPNNDRGCYRLYFCLYRLGRYDEAESVCRQAIAVNPTNSAYCAGLGYCQAQLKHYQEAVASLQRALSLNPENADAYLWLGICQYRLKAYEDAVTSLRRCVSLQPTNSDGYYRMGNSLYMLHRYDEAVAAFQRALKIRPDDFNVNYWLGRNFSELGSYNEAANALQRAIQIKPDDFAANDWRGIILVKSGRFGEAAANFEKAYSIRQEDKSLRLELLLCYLTSSQYEKAYRLYPVILVVGGATSILGYLTGLAILLRFSFKLSPHPFPGLGFSFAWLALFFEGQIAFISCLVLLSFLGISEGFLFGITLAAIPVIFAAARAFARQPWGGPFAWPLRLGTARVIYLTLLGTALVMLLGSYCAEWIAHMMHRPVMVQEIVPLIKYALSANPLAVFVTVVIVAPIAEEIIFRGLLYGAFEKRFRVVGAILISSAIFALAHLQVAYFIPIFCLGIVLGWARWKTGSLGLPILLHVLNNGFALLLLKFFGRGP